MENSLKQTKKDLILNVQILNLIKQSRISGVDLASIGTIFDNHDCIATLSEIRFNSYFMLKDEFYFTLGS